MRKQIFNLSNLCLAFFLLFDAYIFAQADKYGTEIKYDDGSAEEYSAWIEAGGIMAVKFTAPAYPFRLTGGSLYVGDGSFPEGGYFLGKDMVICAFDNDGTNGMPGEILDSVRITVNNYEWVVFDSIFDLEFFDDDVFYLGTMQVTTAPDCPPMGIDTDFPTVYRSYLRQAGGNWMFSTYQDFMIRAKVDNVLNINQNKPGIFIRLFPNPASSYLNIKSSVKVSATTILDLKGNTVSSFDNINSDNRKINISNLPNGIYLAKITVRNTTITKKIIVKK